MDRLLVLGAGRHQAPLIERAEQRGIETIAVDYYADSPGKQIASHSVLADALDIAAVKAAASSLAATAITTIGTDQTVRVLAEVAHDLGLPCHVTPEGALAATHKQHMREALNAHGVAMTSGLTLGPDDDLGALDDLQLPFVVKAADSQGQRGMRRVESLDDVAEAVDLARSFSRTGTVIVEEFANGPELTINAWVRAGVPAMVMPIDRITFNPAPAIGICLQHVIPSLYRHEMTAMAEIARDVAAAFGVNDGPLYIQSLVTDSGIKVVEAACRVGGGHEAQLLEELFDLSLLDLTIDLSLGVNDRELPDLSADRAGLVNFVAAMPGRIDRLEAMTSLIEQNQIAHGQWYISEGHDQAQTTDSMARIGAFIATGSSRAEALGNAEIAYSQLFAGSHDGRNLVMWPNEAELNDPQPTSRTAD